MKLRCPKCHHEVEIIKACGCQDYFCNHCNELVSKSKVIKETNKDQPTKEAENAAQVHTGQPE